MPVPLSHHATPACRAGVFRLVLHGTVHVPRPLRRHLVALQALDLKRAQLARLFLLDFHLFLLDFLLLVLALQELVVSFLEL